MIKKVIDLRSDTVTFPSEAMMNAIMQAELGDDVFCDDPTVIKLQQKVAVLTGKEDSLFVPTGTMANLVAAMTHCGRGDQVVLGRKSHMFLYEKGGLAVVGGMLPNAVVNHPDGTLDREQMQAAVRPQDVHFSDCRLVCVENTHNACYGTPLSPDYMAEIREFTLKNKLKLHLDGARIFNAAAALGVQVKELADFADSMMFCFSKGLSAPVGSVLCGTKEFIAKARGIRKMLGGGMRQVGIIASAALVALEESPPKLIQDHTNATVLAKGINCYEGLEVDLAKVQTNILYCTVKSGKFSAAELVEKLAQYNVLTLALGADLLRFVTNSRVTATDIQTTLQAFDKIMKD